MKVTIKTPLWTGDINTKSNSIQSTGIIGSLRWWMEAILRGMGKFTCDPAMDDRCPNQVTKNNQKISQFCPTCLIFGATGMRRIFRLETNGGSKVFDGRAINIKPPDRNRGWYLGSGLIGEIDLNIVSLDKVFDENFVLVPFVIASNWGGIGAKTQHGGGVVETENEMELKLEDFEGVLERILKKDRLKNLNIEERKEKNDILPDLKEIFFAKVQFEVENDWWKKVDGIKQSLEPKDRRGNIDEEMQKRNNRILEAWYKSGSVPVSPAIKNWLRYKDGRRLWQNRDRNKDRRIVNWLFGTIKNNKLASKINISCAYKVNDNLWEFRIWGWIPKEAVPNSFNRNKFLNDLKGALNGSCSITIPWTTLLGNNTKNHKLIVWREYNSSRDTVKPKGSDIKNYLQSLLKNEGGSE